MGNETSAYHDCRFQEEIQLPGQEKWLINQACAKDGSKVSVFVYQKNGREYDDFVENSVRSLKTLKHPSILKFLAYIDNSDEKWVITERVVPLETIIDNLSPTEICAGLYSVIEALAFLNDRGSICHNNICQTSIFVACDGTWKVGGLEYMCRFSDVTETFLQRTKSLRFMGAISPEEQAGKIEKRLQYAHSRDAFSFGVLAEFLLEYLSPLGDKCSTFEHRIREEFLNPDPRLRPKINTLLQDDIFRDDYVSILNFLKKVTIKTEIEKKIFFSTVGEKLFLLPENTVATRLVRPLLSRFVLMDQNACEFVIPHLLTPCKVRKPLFEPDEINPLLTEEMFKRHIVPEIFKIFHVRDANIRMVLLRHSADYIHLFANSTLSALFPQLLLGLRDSNDDLVAMTLHAVADLVPLLGGDIVIGAKRNHIFKDGKPKFLDGSRPGVNAEKTKNGGSFLLGGVAKPKSSSNKETKDALREKRKEEAMKRNEERKKRREEKMKEQKFMKNDKDAPTDSTAREEDGYPADDPTALPSKSPELSDSDAHEDALAGGQLQLRPETPPSPVHIDWSNREKVTALPVKNVLKLQKKELNKTEDWGQDGSWNDNWEGTSPTRKEMGKSEKNHSGNTPKNKKGPPKIQEIDLFSMDIKTSGAVQAEDEMDFFADMQPELKPQGDSLLSILKGDISKVKSVASEGTSKEEKAAFSSFQVQDSSAIEDGGWDEEAWGDEDGDLDLS